LWAASAAERIDPVPLSGARTVDLCIVGAGFTGLAAALQAAGRGASVAVLEAEAIGHGGSGRNAGLVNAGLWLAPDAVTRTLGEAAGKRLTTILGGAPGRVFDLIEKYQIDCEAVRAGTLHLAHNAAGFRDLRDRCRQLAGLGAPVTLLDGAETAKRTGTEIYAGALHDARAGTIQPLAYCLGLARAAKAAGAEVFAPAKVARASHDGGVWQVETVGGEVRAERLLVATNAYHLGFAGVPALQTTPLHYFQMATRPFDDGKGAPILAGGEGCWDTAPVMTSFRRDRAGRLIVGAIGNLDGPGGAVHGAWARRKLGQLFPERTGFEIEHAWTGRIAMTADHVPKILEIGPRAYAAFGYSGRGIGPGTTFGTLAAEALLADDPALLPLAPVAAHSERFTAARAAFYDLGAALVHTLAVR
jgi:glycine/D-amino acid oxidase-like deaminating enzyme